MIKSYADGRVEDTGPMTRKRMETADDKFTESARRLHRPGTQRRRNRSSPVDHRQRACTSTPASNQNPMGKTGIGIYADGMVEHDGHVGTHALDKLDDLGIADNTIVIYSTDNGAEKVTWPDGGIDPLPRRERHHLGGRLPRPADVARWPGNDQTRHHLQRCHHVPRGLDPHADRQPSANRASPISSKRATAPTAKTGKFTSTATTSPPYLKRRDRRKHPASRSSTSARAAS